jgi:hypothetical protein
MHLAQKKPKDIDGRLGKSLMVRIERGLGDGDQTSGLEVLGLRLQ